MSEIQAEITAVTKPSVAASLGFPADRTEQSPAPTGWQHTVTDGKFEIVSRETSVLE